MEKCHNRLILLLLLGVMFWSFPSETSASSDLLPGEPIDSPFYEKYDRSAYKLDYVPKEDPSGIAETMEVQFYLFLNILLNLGWSLYLFLVEFTIRIVNWAFDKKLTNDLIDILGELFPALENTLWDNLWFLGASVAVLAAVLLWGSGKTQRSALVLAGMIILLAIVPSLLANFPAWIKTVNSVATDIGGEVLVKMVKADQGLFDNMSGQEMARLQRLAETNPQAYEQEMEERRKELEELKEKRGIHAVDDAIWKSLAYETYIVANCGDKEKCTKYIDELLALGDDDEQRREYLRHGDEEGSNKWIDEDGVSKNEDLKQFTKAGFPERATNAVVTGLLGLIPLLALVVFSFLTLYWTGIAMGFAILGVIFLLLAFWPGFGWGEVAYWTWRSFSALLMKLFYAIVLAVFLATWILIQPGGSHLQNLGLGGRIIVISFLLLGFWTAVESLRRKWINPPKLQGGSIAADGTGANDVNVAWDKTKQAIGMPTRLAAMGLKGLRRGHRYQKHRQNQRNIQRAHAENQAILHRMEAGAGAETQDKPQRRVRLRGAEVRQFDSGMAKESKQTFAAMKSEGYDPTQEEDRLAWLEKNPDEANQVSEIGRWSEKRLEKMKKKMSDFDGKTPPPARPQKNTPEYEVWEQSPRWRKHWGLYQKAKKQVNERYKQDYLDRYKKYERSVSRYFRQPPRYHQPSERAYLREYRKMARPQENEER
ncbi:hypothetical protein [Desmospora activa]|uniref:TrbL/VirB6 plasmid conjugal transfer protein n=1 Tax=Desmospora activa DSM 45169 TaxID=1121389 RepID=A0A2T4YZN1_9BACL|nr:hypothetical protein [Desmospora activa]PTM52717.1 hypothetical protein C8J48_3710 [Desmospora activa DSM 45169]